MIGHSQLTQAQQQIVDGLHKAAEKNAPNLEFSLEENITRTKQLSEDLNIASERMRIIGIAQLEVFDDEEGKSASRISEQAKGAREVSSDLDKEESYRHKTSKQEAAAVRRGEYASYQTNKAAVAQAAIAQYDRFRAAPDQAPQVTDCSGEEFIYLPGDTDTDIANRICNLLRYRDQEKARIEQKKTGKLTECDLIYIKHREELIASMEDAINTWHLANGVDGLGGVAKISAVRKAQKHLPLALEKYNYMVRNVDKLIARDFLKSKTVREHPDYKKVAKEFADEDKKNATRRHVPAGLGPDGGGQTDQLQKAIMANPQAYQAKKDKIDRLYAYFVQRMRKATELGAEATLPQFDMKIMDATRYFTEFKNGLDNIANDSVYMINTLKLEAESARDYILYLLTGQQADVIHGSFIEKIWGEHIFEQSNSPHDIVAYNSVYAADIQAQYGAKLTELNDRMQALPATAPPEEQEALAEAVREMQTNRYKSPVIRRSVLARMSDQNLRIRILQHKMMDTAEVLPLKQRRVFNHPAFHHLAEAAVSFGQDPNVQLPELVTAAKDLSVVMTGRQVADDKKEELKTEQTAAARRLIQLFLPRVADLETFMNAHPEMLKQRNSIDLFENSGHLSAFVNRAEALQGVLNIVFDSPAFEELQPAEQDAFKAAYCKLEAMAATSGVLQTNQDLLMTRMSADALIAQRNKPQSRSYEEILSLATDRINTAYTNREQRTYRRFL